MAEKKFYAGGPVAYWKVVSRNKVYETFSRKREADAYVAASKNPRLYTVLPVYEKEEKRGGKRPNSGRKKKDVSGKVVTVSFCCSPEQRDRLNAGVEGSGLSRSEYICKKLFGGVFMKRFYVLAERVSVDGYPEQFTVGYDNTATDDFDSFMLFDTKEQAEKWIESEQAKEWKGCSFSICEAE